jgi:hypothetical protein
MKSELRLGWTIETLPGNLFDALLVLRIKTIIVEKKLEFTRTESDSPLITATGVRSP